MMTKMYRRDEVKAITGLSTSSIYRLMADGSFPRPVRIGERAVAWTEQSLIDWMSERDAA